MPGYFKKGIYGGIMNDVDLNKQVIYKNFARRICGELNLPPCCIKVVQKLNTDTQMAAAEPKANIIYLKEGLAEPDALFSICHELRYIWQRRHGLYSEKYRTNEELSIRGYNLQPEEIDANAFAKVMMVSLFGITPQFDGLPEDIKTLITKRASDIAH